MNLWILTEERPKPEDIKFILEKTSKKLGHKSNFENISIEPDIEDNFFKHRYFVKGASIENIKSILIYTVSSSSSFVDALIYYQNEVPDPSQLFQNCIYAIEETKTNTYDSRNTAMGQRSTKFNFLNYYKEKYKYNFTPVMFFTSKQAEADHDSVNFVNRMLLHLESGIEFWNKDLENLKKFYDLEEFIEVKNKISLTNSRANDTPLTIDMTDKEIKISALLANPNNTRPNYTGRIGHDPNMGQVPLIAKTLRNLGWNKKIVITNHQILQDRISKRGNKLTALASYINFELEGIDLPDTPFNNEYWEFEKRKEKVASILAQVVLSNKGLKTIFDNHGGCEKSYFLTSDGENLVIPKKYSENGGKIPDLVMVDYEKKEIYSYEGKTNSYINQGLDELENFDLFESDFLGKYYPDFKFFRSLIINGGKELSHDQVSFQILDSGKIEINSQEFVN